MFKPAMMGGSDSRIKQNQFLLNVLLKGFNYDTCKNAGACCAEKGFNPSASPHQSVSEIFSLCDRTVLCY